ncbi:DUF3800 domain-containing protein [Leptospira sarikeiensis]|uniref:DUF3800 domain-containing protein n=1 Tax=Leptospira sarikeiensis TaxID=2484943 RepID=A0A4R9K2Y6_9LEPT|nr:DUF3800 domain-containing protein [Leptospira sarikeiensis]TGL59506.1 DUF3800 domain-containing protein [Leptospira sarikeiensis]
MGISELLLYIKRKIRNDAPVNQVAFDEAGNTGQNLIDLSQPVFALASVHMTEYQIASIRKSAKLLPNEEFHFVRFARNRQGQERILNMLRNNNISRKTCAITVFHKQYMAIVKIVDMLVEELAYQNGFDIYRKGMNQAMSNLFHTVLPVFCGSELFEELIDSFVRAVRKRDAVVINRFYNVIKKMHRSCTDEDFKSELLMLLETSVIAKSVFKNARVTSIDPAIPAFVNLTSHWSELLNQPFDILHDRSKPIEHEQELLSYFMDADEQEILVGYDRRKAKFPLKATGIQFVDSKLCPAVQIADLLSSAIVFYLKGVLDSSLRSPFWYELEKFKKRLWSGLIVNPLWPSADVTPEQLGTEKSGVLIWLNM